jgi:mono/diheme cytochrome c family protein
MRNLILVVLFVVACQPETGSLFARPMETTASPILIPIQEQIRQGEFLYLEHCASCHGANLEGQADWKIQNDDGSFRAPPHDASGHTWHHGDPSLLEAIRLGGSRFEGLNIGGTSDMPAFEDILTDEEIVAVLTYIKSTWPEDVQTVQQQATLREENNDNE